MKKMKWRHWILCLSMLSITTLFTCSIGGCANTPDNTAAVKTNGETQADIVLKNGIIQTMISEADRQEAVAIKGNEIIYVGNNEDVKDYIGTDTQVIDLEGAMVTPGFMDGHIHTPGKWLNQLYEINFDGCTTNDEYLKNIAEFIEEHPDYSTYSGGTFMLNHTPKRMDPTQVL